MLGEKILDLRTQKNMSQGDLADALEISRQSVSKWENNVSVPDLDKLIAISELLGVSIDFLVKGKEDEIVSQEPALKKNNTSTPIRCSRRMMGVILLISGLIGIMLIKTTESAALLFPVIVYVALAGILCLTVKKHLAMKLRWIAFGMVHLYVCFYFAMSFTGM